MSNEANVYYIVRQYYVDELKLKGAELQIFSLIATFNNCYLTQEQMTRATGLSLRTITYAIKKLVEKGYIEKTKTTRNQYVLSMELSSILNNAKIACDIANIAMSNTQKLRSQTRKNCDTIKDNIKVNNKYIKEYNKKEIVSDDEMEQILNGIDTLKN